VTAPTTAATPTPPGPVTATARDEANALARRLLCTNLWAWAAITVVMTVYVVRAYPSDVGVLTVAARQVASWMPFAFVLPVLALVAGRMPESLGRGARALVFSLGGVVVVLGYSLVRHGALRLLTAALGAQPEAWTTGLTHFWPIAAIVYAVLLMLLSGVLARSARERTEQTARRLEAELARAQLAALQMQIRPHFLFNTLQTIEDACWREPKLASAMILQLSALLRASLEGERRGEQTLAADLRLARQYMDLQRARFGERLRYVERVDEGLSDQPLPPLFLQPLLENAIVHGIEHLEAGGEVLLTARHDGDGFVLRVENDGPVAARNGASATPGVGLANTAARLRSVYGDTARLDFRPRPAGGAVVEVRAPRRAVG
jgi:hypothetical protein